MRAELEIPDHSKMDTSPFLNVMAQRLSRVSCTARKRSSHFVSNDAAESCARKTSPIESLPGLMGNYTEPIQLSLALDLDLSEISHFPVSKIR
jgi:hypothetical protein